MSHLQKISKAAITAIFIISMLFTSGLFTDTAYASSGHGFVLLSSYSRTMKIGQEYHLAAVTSNGKRPGFSSSNSRVASVNTYGRITAKKAGSAVITAKIKNGEARCRVTVKKTAVTLNTRSLSMENGEKVRLKATVSTGHPATYRSSRSSIASVNEKGMVQAKKPGTAVITATADGTSVTCRVTVRYPRMKLNKSSVSLYRKQRVRLSVASSSKIRPKWKSNKKSVATVDPTGLVTAVKNGTALITATIDGISKTCEVTVKKPEIRFTNSRITLKVGQSFQIRAIVSSGNRPEYSSSNINRVSVDENGKIYAKALGKAYIYAKEDGTKERVEVVIVD